MTRSTAFLRNNPVDIPESNIPSFHPSCQYAQVTANESCLVDQAKDSEESMKFLAVGVRGCIAKHKDKQNDEKINGTLRSEVRDPLSQFIPVSSIPLRKGT
jgi:hypothetical protein